MTARRLRAVATASVVATAMGVAIEAASAARPWSADSTAGPLRQFRRIDPSPAATGSLLVASRRVIDPNFRQTVVLLFHVSAEGAAGLIVNRPDDRTVGDLLPDLAAGRSAALPSFVGGPVGRPGVRVLLRSPGVVAGAERIVDDIHLLTRRDGLDTELAADVGIDVVRVFAGYSGWGAGQLERELAGGSWHVFDGEGGIVFDPNPATIWNRQIRRAEGLSARVRTRPAGAS